ncbi:MAG: hypothetical protein ACRCSM_02125 [Sediminibacterium sp.]|jgi:hypothetical protein|nr:hypothetical protein [Chitinophagaceae bacterium]MCA6446893.1 hypothetical protein [Chitinophagaceae bacterium]
MTIDYKKLAKEAATATNKEYADQIALLTNFKSADIQKIIQQNDIDKEDFLKLIDIIKNNTLDNEKKATAIREINRGLETIISLVSKLI